MSAFTPAQRAGVGLLIGIAGCSGSDQEVEAAVERARKRHDQNSSRFPFDAEREADKASVGAWRAPKVAHKRLVNRLLQCRAHLVICLRAEDKLRMETREEEGRNGRTYTKTTIIPAEKLPPSERWAPVCEKRLPYELITSLALSPDAPGVPIPLKLQAQHRPFVPLDRPLDERVGEQLAAWARGAKPAGPTPAKPPSNPPPSAEGARGVSSPVQHPETSAGGGADAPQAPAPDPEEEAALAAALEPFAEEIAACATRSALEEWGLTRGAAIREAVSEALYLRVAEAYRQRKRALASQLETA